MKVVRRTRDGVPDEPISFWKLVGSMAGVVVLVVSAATWSVNMIVFKAQAETKDQLRQELNTKMDDIRKTTWPQFYTKAEIDERRKELDRRYDEEKKALADIQQAILELKLHDAQEATKTGR